MTHPRLPSLHYSRPTVVQVAAALPRADQRGACAQQQGRLWTTVFACMMEAGRYEVGAALVPASVTLHCFSSGVACMLHCPHQPDLITQHSDRTRPCRAPFTPPAPPLSLPFVPTQEAYVALLSNEVTEVQLDCLHRLVAGLCAAPGGVELLCRLPFAQNLPVSAGRPLWCSPCWCSSAVCPGCCAMCCPFENLSVPAFPASACVLVSSGHGLAP